MTEKQLLKRVEFWRQRVIPEWRVAVMDHPPPGLDREYVACAESDLSINEVRLFFKDEVRAMARHSADRIIVHELLHPALDRVLDHEDVLKEHVTPVLWNAYLDGRHATMEEFVNRMAHAIVDAHHGVLTNYTRAVTASDPKERKTS